MRAILLAALAACTTTAAPPARQPATSRGLHADEHLDEAREHAKRARELERWPEMRRSDTGRLDDANTGLWYRMWDQAHEEQRLAEVHRSQAAQLQAAYDEACATLAPDTIRVSPIQRYGTGGMPTADGVVIFLEPDAVASDRLLAEIRCHRAWMMLSEGGMDTCPLDLPNIRVQAHGDARGVSVEIRVRDAKLVGDLQRRAAHDLELASQRKR